MKKTKSKNVIRKTKKKLNLISKGEEETNYQKKEEKNEKVIFK